MIFKIIITIIVLCLLAFAAFWIIDEFKYSYKVNEGLKDNNATCYFDRGIFNIPLARICTYNKTLMIEKEGE